MKRFSDYFIEKFFPQFARSAYTLERKKEIQELRLTKTKQELVDELDRLLNEFNEIAESIDDKSIIAEINEILERHKCLAKAYEENTISKQDFEAVKRKLDTALNSLRRVHA